MLPGAVQALREAVQPPGDHQGRDIIEKEVVKALAPPLLRQPLQIGDLRLAHHLEAAGVKIVVKIVELEAGAVHIRDGQQHGVKIGALVQHLQIELSHKFRHLQSAFLHSLFHSLSGRRTLRRAHSAASF